MFAAFCFPVYTQSTEGSDREPSLVYNDIKDPSKISLRHRKPVLLLFYTTWSETYDRMKETTLKIPAIKEFLGQFHVEWIDAESDQLGVDLKLTYQLSSYPTIIAYSEFGRLGSIQGLWPPFTFLKLLKDWYETWRSESPVRKNSLPSDPILGAIGYETRTKKEIRRSGGFQLRTGKVLDGTPIGLSSGIVTLMNEDQVNKLPLYLFTPKSRELVLTKAKNYVFKEKNISAGPHGMIFREIGGIIEINELRTELQEPFVVLIDPRQEFQSLLNNYLIDQPLARNELSYIPKYKIASDLSDRSLGFIYRKYSIEPPAALIIDSNGVVKQFSEMRVPAQFLAEIKSMRDAMTNDTQVSLPKKP